MITVEQFAKIFKNEKDFRNKLLGLFRNVPGYQGVRETHGSVERGKDIVFYCHDPLSGYRCNICVVKNTPITGNASSNRGAMAVLTQARQALETPRVADDGKPEFADTVFIISPYECSESTMLSVQGSLESRKGSVRFLCGSRLLELFEKYYATALLFDSTFLGNYVVQLRASMLRADPVRFLIEQSDILSSGLKQFESVYVKQDFKKTFCTYSAKRDTFSPRSTLESMGRTAFSSVILWVERMPTFVFDDQVWTGTAESSRKRIKDRSAKLREKLSRIFEESWYSNLIPSQGNPSLDLRAVSIPPECESEYQWLRAVVMGEASAFLGRLKQANEYTASLELPVNLEGSEFYNYCAVEDVISRHSDLFKPSSSPRTVNLVRSEIENTAHAIWITAAAGYGKTSFCKWQILDSVRQLELRRSDCVPFYTPLHRLASEGLSGNAEEVFLQDHAVLELFRDLCKAGQSVRMFFDGLDEVTTPARRQQLMQHVETITKKYPSVSVVVTSRSYVGGRSLNWLSRIELSELTDEQIESLVSKWLGDKSDDYHLFFSQLGESHTLEPLTRVPLLCTLIIAVFRRNKALPSSRVRLYEIVVDLMCGGWDLAKNIRRTLRFGSELKKEVLTRYAGILHAGHRRDGTEEEFGAAVAEYGGRSGDRWREVLGEVLEDGLLTSTGGKLAFSHLSFQEYLASRDINDPSGKLQQRALHYYFVGDDWWIEVLVFLLAVAPRPAEMRRWVLNEAKKTLTVSVSATNKVTRLFKRLDYSIEANQEAV